MPPASENRPTVLLVGRGEPLDAALRVALDRHGLFVEESVGELRNAVKMTAPDLILLLGDAAAGGGRASLDLLSSDGLTAAVPIAVLGPPEAFDARVRAFRHGAVAVIPRIASADAIATQIAALVGDLGDRGSRPDELGEATLDDLVQLVGRELRNGILSVEPAQRIDREGQPLRIVLGAGRPVAAAVEEFVRKLAPLVSRAEPLVYELHQGPGGAVALVDGEGESQVDVRIFDGLRVLVIDSDPSRADALAQELRARKATVAVADAKGTGLERARALDPDIVLVDTQGIEGPGFEVVRRIRADHRLRWASLLVVPWDELWPSPEGAPDVGRLAEQIQPLVVPDRVLRDRAEKEKAFETRLEATGPSRLVRALAGLVGPFHVSVRSSKALVEVDVAEGLVVGATGATAKGERLEGARALAALLALGAGRARVEQRSHAATANLMVPVDQALALADREASPVPHSLPPPSNRPPEPVSRVDRRSDRSGPYRSLGAPASRAQPQAGRVAARDLRWTDSSMDSSWKDSEPTFPVAPEERTKEIEIPSVPPGVARTSLPAGIANVVTEGSVMAPLPIKPAASARMSAFAAPTIREPRATPAVPPARGLVVDAAKVASESSWGTGTTGTALPAVSPSARGPSVQSATLKGANPQGASSQGASSQGASSQGANAQRPTVKSSTVEDHQYGLHGEGAQKTDAAHSDTTARPGEVKRPLETSRPGGRASGLFTDTPQDPAQRDNAHTAHASRTAVPSGAFSGNTASSPGSRSSPGFPTVPRANVTRPPAVTPVAMPAVGGARGSRPSANKTLAFGAPSSAPAPEITSARFPRHARTVQGIQGEKAELAKPALDLDPEDLVDLPGVVSRGGRPTPLATPAAISTQPTPQALAAPISSKATPIVATPAMSPAPLPVERDDGLPAALFGDDDEPELPAVLRDGLPDVPSRADAAQPLRSEPPQDPGAAVDDIVATLGALPASTPLAPPTRPAALRDAPPPIDLPDP
ncbi:MAG: hypothetical protein J0L92_35355, partial [Deltaproteobacteria bacterium]|nr:hypothetical protein [Deltaproteobacteria bacterium]